MKVIIPEMSAHGVTLPSLELEGRASHFKKLVGTLYKVYEEYISSNPAPHRLERFICNKVINHIRFNNKYDFMYKRFIRKEFVKKVGIALGDTRAGETSASTIGKYLLANYGSQHYPPGLGDTLRPLWVWHIIQAIEDELFQNRESRRRLRERAFTMNTVLCIVICFVFAYIGDSVAVLLSAVFSLIIIKATKPSRRKP